MLRPELSLLVLSCLLLSSVAAAIQIKNDPLLAFQQELIAQQQQLAHQQQQVQQQQQQQTQQAPTISFPLADMGPSQGAAPSYAIPLPPSQTGSPAFSETAATIQTRDSITDQLLKAFMKPQVNGQKPASDSHHSHSRRRVRSHRRDDFPRFRSRRGRGHYWTPHSHYEHYYSHPRFREQFYPKPHHQKNSHHDLEDQEDDHKQHDKHKQKVSEPVVPISPEPKLEYADALAGKSPAFVEMQGSGYITGAEPGQHAGWSPPLVQSSSSPLPAAAQSPTLQSNNMEQALAQQQAQLAQQAPRFRELSQQAAQFTHSAAARVADPVSMPFYAPTPPPPLAANQVPSSPGVMNTYPFAPTASNSAMISALSAQEQAQNPAAFNMNPNAGSPPRFFQQTFPFSGSFLEIDEQDLSREEIKDYIHPRLHLLAVHPDRHLYSSPLLDEHIEPFPLLDEKKHE